MRFDKVAPGLMVLLDSFQSGGMSGALSLARNFGVVADEKAVMPRTIAFVEAAGDTDLGYLAEKGVTVNPGKGRIRTANFPLENLDLHSEDPNVQRIYPTRYLRPALDVATPLVQVPSFRGRYSPNLSGEGVVIGIVDSGIDGAHRAFNGRIHSVLGPNGKRIWRAGRKIRDRTLGRENCAFERHQWSWYTRCRYRVRR